MFEKYKFLEALGLCCQKALQRTRFLLLGLPCG